MSNTDLQEQLTTLMSEMAALQKELHALAPLPLAVLLTPERIGAIYQLIDATEQVIASGEGDEDDQTAVNIVRDMLDEVKP
jgi:hypothetical protein